MKLFGEPIAKSLKWIFVIFLKINNQFSPANVFWQNKILFFDMPKKIEYIFVLCICRQNSITGSC
jgi:hypothetical protein